MTESGPIHTRVSPRRLWFGFAGGAAAWVTLGITDLLIAWQICQGGHRGWGPLSEGGVLALFAVVTLLLLLVALFSGLTAYRNWQSNASAPHLLDSLAVGREEFMGVAGWFVALSFTVGIIWLGLPFALIDICARAR